MKQLLSLVCAFLLLLSLPLFSAGAAQQPSVAARAYVLYCPDNGKVLLSQNENSRMKPASTTKLMTTLLTLEQAAKENRSVTFTEEMVAEGSSMYLGAGDKLTLRDLAAGMMMASGNDAANAAAIDICGSQKAFAKRMNRRAGEIGMRHTHFVTPSGLDAKAHYSTAYDLALLMAEGLRNRDFSRLTSQRSATVSFIRPADKRVTYSNHNRLLRLYEDCIGGKTGYTTDAGRCLVSAAQRNGLTLICVTLDDRNDWNDHIALYDYGFARYTLYRSEDSSFCADVPCAGGMCDSVAVMGEKDAAFVTECGREKKIKRTVYLDSFLYAPVKQGEQVGSIEYTLGGKRVDTVRLVAAQDIALQKRGKSLLDYIKELFGNG